MTGRAEKVEPLATQTFDDHILRIVRQVSPNSSCSSPSCFHCFIFANRWIERSARGVRPSGRAVLSGLTNPEEIAKYDDEEHDLDARKVTEAFARAGLYVACSNRHGKLSSTRIFSRNNSALDLIVLDWVYYRDEGRKALKIVQRILTSEKTGHPEGTAPADRRYIYGAAEAQGYCKTAARYYG